MRPWCLRYFYRTCTLSCVYIYRAVSLKQAKTSYRIGCNQPIQPSDRHPTREPCTVPRASWQDESSPSGVASRSFFPLLPFRLIHLLRFFTLPVRLIQLRPPPSPPPSRVRTPPREPALGRIGGRAIGAPWRQRQRRVPLPIWSQACRPGPPLPSRPILPPREMASGGSPRQPLLPCRLPAPPPGGGVAAGAVVQEEPGIHQAVAAVVVGSSSGRWSQGRPRRQGRRRRRGREQPHKGGGLFVKINMDGVPIGQ